MQVPGRALVKEFHIKLKDEPAFSPCRPVKSVIYGIAVE